MSEQPIAISHLNDFIFCPASIYFHALEQGEHLLVQSPDQLNGTKAHEKSDSATYSTQKNMLQGIGIYSETYNLIGKIDVFDCQNGILTERKKKIKTIYDGYVFQLYAQYYCLVEMGLNNIVTDINTKWMKTFDETDSVYIFQLSSTCKTYRFGYARHDDQELLIVT